MSVVGQFAGGVAHDVNNMVTVVLTCTDLLERRLPEGHPARAETAEITAAAERASALAKQLLGFARRTPSVRSPFDVADVVKRSEWLLSRAAGPEVEIVIALSASDHRVIGDARLFEQVLINLTINARDAMPEGGRVEIATVDAMDADGARALELTVRDTGVGMDEATRQRALEPFFTTKGAAEGTGLGLSVAVEIIEGMGGEITLDSAPAQGTTVRIRLPIHVLAPNKA
jgi:signal transduction histidine kinase